MCVSFHNDRTKYRICADRQTRAANVRVFFLPTDPTNYERTNGGCTDNNGGLGLDVVNLNLGLF